MHRSRRLLLVTLALAAPGLGALTPAAGAQGSAVCDARHVLSAKFHSRVCGVPDYDQRREPALLTGADRQRSVSGLPGGGACHCVPTSFANLLGYYAQKGVDVLPGSYPWLARPPFTSGGAPGGYLDRAAYSDGEIDAYNEVTKLVAFLGTKVNFTSGCGTTFESVIEYHKMLTDAGFFKRAKFTSRVSLSSRTTPREIAVTQALGGLASVAYGFWSNFRGFTDGTATAQGRPAGHVVAVEGVSGSTDRASILVRDPAQNYGSLADDRDPYRQGHFAFDKGDLRPVRMQTMWGVVEGWTWGQKVQDLQRVLDGWMALTPTYLVTVDGQNLGYMPGVALNQQDQAAVKSIPVGARILDATFLAATGEIAYVTEGGRQIRAVSVVTGARRSVGPAPPRAKDLESDPSGRRLYTLAGRTLQVTDLQTRKLARRLLPRPADALAYDPSPATAEAERIVAVSTAAGRAYRLRPASLRPAGSAKLPAAALQGTGRLAASFEDGGDLLVRRGAAAQIQSARRGGQVAARPLPAGAAARAGGLAAVDGGTTVTVVDGRLAELTAAGEVVAGSPFTGALAPGRVVAVSRSAVTVPASMLQVRMDRRMPYHPGAPEASMTPPPAKSQPAPSPGNQQAPPAAHRAPDLQFSDARSGFMVIQNRGATAAGPFRVQIRNRADTSREVVQVTGIPAGGEVRVTYKCRGQVERWADLDAFNEVAETDETNNRRSWTDICAS